MHKPLLFGRPSFAALATALQTIPQPEVQTPGALQEFTTPEGYPFTLIPVKTREDGE